MNVLTKLLIAALISLFGSLTEETKASQKDPIIDEENALEVEEQAENTCTLTGRDFEK